MAEGFKKYFNGTTINGRANVAKATYATLALLYIVYRMRRGSAKEENQLASDKCTCDAEIEPMPHGDTGIYGVDPECSVCRDREQQRRSAGEDSDKCRDDPPPPPPSSSGSGGSNGGAGSAKPRVKCPCEDSQRRVNGAVKTSSNNMTKAWAHQLQPPKQYQQHFQQHDASSSTTATEQVSSAGELVGQVQDAVSGVLRSVIGAVLGAAAVNTSGSSASEAQSQAQLAYSAQDVGQGEEEEEEEEEQGWDNDQEHESRNAQRFCVPTNNNNHNGSQPEEEGAKDNYNAFTDGFASDMYFTSDEQ